MRIWKMKFVKPVMAMLVMLTVVLTALPVSISADDIETVDIGDTGDITNIGDLKRMLSTVADIEEDGNTITIKLNKNIIGRICFAIPGAYIIFDANGRTISGGTYNEPICLANFNYNTDSCTLELIGDGIYNEGGNNVIYVGEYNNLIIKSATLNGNFYGAWGTATAQLEDEYDYYRITKNGTAITVSNSNEINHTEVYKIRDYDGQLIVKQYEYCVEHTYGDDNKCDICEYEKPVPAPSITTQPENASIKVGETVTFAITATGTDLIYQWQINRNDGNGFVNIANATGANYTTSTVTKDCNGFKYQCIVSNSAGTVKSNEVTLTVTEQEPATEMPAPSYTIIEGKDESWTQGTTETVTVRADGDFAKFTGVKVNDTLIDAKNYTAVSGSTVVTLKEEYLNTLEAGTYKLTIEFTDGSCSTNFVVEKAVQDNPVPPTEPQNPTISNNPTEPQNPGATSPKTADTTSIFSLGMLVTLGVFVLLKKKSRA